MSAEPEMFADLPELSVTCQGCERTFKNSRDLQLHLEGINRRGTPDNRARHSMAPKSIQRSFGANARVPKDPAPEVEGVPGDSPSPRRRTILDRFRKRPEGEPDATPLPKRPKRSGAARGGRTSLAPAGTLLWKGAEMAAARAGDIPVAKVLSVQAPMAGQVLDNALRGTFLDKLVQPVIGEADKYADIGALLAFPMLVAMYERQPNPMLDGVLDMLIRQNLLAMAKAIKAAKVEAAKMAEATAELAEAGMKFEGDPVSDMKRWLFGDKEAPPPDLDPLVAQPVEVPA